MGTAWRGGWQGVVSVLGGNAGGHCSRRAHHSPFFGRRHGVSSGGKLIKIPADSPDGKGGGGGKHSRVLP